MELYLLIVMPVFASLLLYLLPTRQITWLAAAICTGVFAISIHLFWRVRFMGETITTGGEQGFLGITLYCDLTASVFLVLVSFLFLCVYLYTNLTVRVNKLYSFLMSALEGLIILIFLSRDLFNIYVAVEVATLVCSILIMFKKESRSIYDGLVYLLTNIVGMLFFLLGIGMLYRQTGVLDMTAVKEILSGGNPLSPDRLMDAKDILLPYALIMTGTCLKCALFPMHFWLPHAHGTPGAPTAVSAILSGLYVKGGIYLFIRMQDMFSPMVDISVFFLWAGILTSVFGIVMAVCQSDIKLVLAYHTISQVGLIIAGLCTGNTYGQAGAMLHIVNHALFKSLLFLTAGILIHKYHTRNVYEIRGVMKSLPLVGFSIAAGILGITGAPLFNGSISKYFIAKGGNWLVAAFFVLINFGTTLSFVKFGKMLFGSSSIKKTRHDFLPTAVVIMLGSLCFFTGVLAIPFIEFFFNIRMEIGFSSYLAKCLVWFATFILAWLAYRYGISKIPRLREGIDLNPSFRIMIFGICTSFAFLFGAGLLIT